MRGDVDVVGQRELTQVSLWVLHVTSYANRESAWRLLLDPTEREKARRFHFPRDRVQYIVAHGVLRSILGRELSVAPAALKFGTSDYGKPFLLDEAHRSLQFNMSH